LLREGEEGAWLVDIYRSVYVYIYIGNIYLHIYIEREREAGGEAVGQVENGAWARLGSRRNPCL